MTNELYTRQETLDLTPIPAATVVGCGGTGSWVALFLAMSGCECLHLMDMDKVEVSNLNRLPLPDAAKGLPKTLAIGAFITTLRPNCVVAEHGKAGPFSLVLTEGIIFDCTDNQDTQRMLFTWAKENGRPYIRDGYDGTHFTVLDHTPTWRTTDAARTGYEITPSWVVPAALAAALGVAKAMYCPTLNVSLDINEIGKK